MSISTIAFVFSVAVSFYLASRYHNFSKYTGNTFRELAEENGYTYSEEDTRNSMDPVKDSCFSFFEKGSDPVFRNVVKGSLLRGEIFLFHYSTRRGKSSSTIRGEIYNEEPEEYRVKTLVIYLNQTDNVLPRFIFRKRSYVTVARKTGPDMVSIPNESAFNNEYYLMSKDHKEEMVRLFQGLVSEIRDRKIRFDVDCNGQAILCHLEQRSTGKLLKKELTDAIWLIKKLV